MSRQAFVHFPSAPLTESLIHTALKELDETIVITDTPPLAPTRLLQYSSYELQNHELTHAQPDSVLASSYTIRKCLIRKHYLHRALSSYVTKRPDSILALGIPRTWDIDIAWADEVDDLFADELWDVAKMLEDGSGKWFILKAGMADGGHGIRLFNSKRALHAIFEEFDEKSDAESENGAQDIITSQLRHFVIQEYLVRPLLVNPFQTVPGPRAAPNPELPPYKFHLRAYCVAAGALTLYLWPHILALFSAAPFSAPSYDATGIIDLAPHLTNSALQSEPTVRLLSELVGCSVLSMPGEACLAASDISEIVDQTAKLLADAFRAAVASPVHFQPLPNMFELFGADLLVTHVGPRVDNAVGPRFQVYLLEMNAEPAIELTSQRLHWVLEKMFKAIARVCVGPFFGVQGCGGEHWQTGETKCGLRKCLEVDVRGLKN